MKRRFVFLAGLIFLIIAGCATPGQKFIDIDYYRSHDASETDPNKGRKIGIATFKDSRTDAGEGYVGYRILNDNSRETYLVNGLDLGTSLQKAFLSYYKRHGFETAPIKPWEFSQEGAKKAINDFDLIIGGSINKFECQAKKKGFVTEMTLDIDITLYAGSADTNTRKKIPLALIVERTEVNFSLQKFEHFVNLAVEDMMNKAGIQ